MLIADSPLIHLKTASCMSKRKMKKNCEEGNFYTKICCLLKRQAKHNASVGQINTKVKPGATIFQIKGILHTNFGL